MSNDYREFKDNDKGYKKWIKKNNRGFVVNTYRTPSKNFLKLHCATCKSINRKGGKNWTTKNYIKICSLDKLVLIEWGKNAVEGRLNSCKVCKPHKHNVG